MSDWRDMLFSKLTPGVSPLTLVADPDSLLLEERVLAGLREHRFEVIEYEDPVAFRYVSESRYRSPEPSSACTSPTPSRSRSASACS